MKKFIVIAVAGLLACPGLSMAGGDQPTTNANNLNSSKSNLNRQQSLPTTDPATNVTTVKGSKSNASERTSGQSSQAEGQAGIAVSDPGSPADDAKPVKTK
jgi:hypothetical protein